MRNILDVLAYFFALVVLIAAVINAKIVSESKKWSDIFKGRGRDD